MLDWQSGEGPLGGSAQKQNKYEAHYVHRLTGNKPRGVAMEIAVVMALNGAIPQARRQGLSVPGVAGRVPQP